MMKKNDEFEIEITDLTNDGEGVGKTDSFTWFIKDTVPGDRVLASAMKIKSSYGYARLIKVLNASDDRVPEACSKARACGGCSLQSMSYEAQLRFKANKVKNNLKRIGNILPETYVYDEIIGMDEPYRYRNKTIIPFGRDKNGKVIYGFYARHSHDIISCDDCLLGDEDNKRIAEIIKKYYSDNIRNVLIRRGRKTKQTMVCIITRSQKLDYKEEIINELNVDTVVQNINPDDTNVILGKKEIVLSGKGYIEDYLGDLLFKISAKSFYQVNPIQVEKLYGTASEFAGLTGGETVWDLYCGIGTITLSLAQKAKKVYGIEIIEEAIKDAKINAELNGITNTEFFTGRAEELLPEKYEVTKERPDVIVVDPPRKGCDKKCLDTMIEMQPERIVYVSCDSATLARDLRILCDGGYEVKRVRPVDMFPQTTHVETVVLLSRTEK